MAAASFTTARLFGVPDDARLSVHATNATPVWLASPDGSRMLWANPAGCAAFGTNALGTLVSRVFAPGDSTRAHVARLATTLPRGDAVRLERLRGFVGPGAQLRWRPLLCACSRLVFDGTRGVLVVAKEWIGPPLSLAERVRRLDLDPDAAIAAFAPDGAILFATDSARRHLAEPARLGVGAEPAAQALAMGMATATTAAGTTLIRRVGSGADTVLLARFEPSEPVAAPLSAAPPIAVVSPPTAALAAGELGSQETEIPVAGNVVPFPGAVAVADARTVEEDGSIPGLSEPTGLHALARRVAVRLPDGEDPRPADADPGQHPAVTQAREWRAMADAATDAIFAIDKAGRITAANRAGAAFLDRVGDAPSGSRLTDMMAPDGTAARFIEALRGPGRFSGEVTIRAADGRLIPLHLAMAPIDHDRLSVVLHDITAVKAAESAAATAQQRADSAALDKSEAFARLESEVQRWLTAVFDICDLMLEERLGPVGNDHYRECIATVRRSGAHLMSAVADAAQLAKIEAGRFTLSPTDVSLNQIVAECVSEMQLPASKARVIVRTALAASAPPIVADRGAVRQMAAALLGHALKTTPAGGQVIVSTGAASNGDITLRIRHDGDRSTDAENGAAPSSIPQAPPQTFANSAFPLTRALAEANQVRLKVIGKPRDGALFELSFAPPAGTPCRDPGSADLPGPVDDHLIR